MGKLYSLKGKVNSLSGACGISTNYNYFLNLLVSFFEPHTRKNSERTKNFYSAHPCTIGYNFCLILADGRLLPCCASSLVMGKIGAQSFKEIWHSEKYANFRREGLLLPTTGKPIGGCECWNCGHVM